MTPADWCKEIHGLIDRAPDPPARRELGEPLRPPNAADFCGACGHLWIAHGTMTRCQDRRGAAGGNLGNLGEPDPGGDAMAEINAELARMDRDRG